MGKLLEHIKSTWKGAFKTVLHAKKRFFPFFLSIFLLQCILFLLILSCNSAIETREAIVTEEYDYHLVISGLTREQLNALETDLGYDGTYYTHQVMHYTSVSATGTYTAYVRLEAGLDHLSKIKRWGVDQSLEGLREKFMDQYTNFYPVLNRGNVVILESPLYHLGEEIAGVKAHRNLALAVATLLGAITMISLYRIHTGNEKFQFGIYATFGANAFRLRENALAQLLACSLLTILPAYYLSSLACVFVFDRASPYAFRFHFLKLSALLLVLLLLAVMLLLAVYLPMKRISLTEPMKLLSAADNSNLVSAPRASVKPEKLSFPFGYSGVSAWRFRRHHTLLAFTSAFFCVIFVCGLYLSGVWQDNRQIVYATSPEFTVSFPGRLNADGSEMTVVSAADMETFSGFAGVESIHKSYSSLPAEKCNVYLTVSGKNVGNASPLLRSPNGADAYLTGGLNLLCAVDDDLLSLLEETYQIRGDIHLLTQSDENVRYIAISATAENKDAFRLSLGDTVDLSRAMLDEKGNLVWLDEENHTPIEGMVTGNKLLEEQLARYAYESKTFVVAAILENAPSAATGIPVVLMQEDYEWLTRTTATANELNLTLEKEITAEEYDNLYHSLLLLTTLNATSQLTCHNVYNTYRFENNTPYAGLYTLLFALCLCLIPLVWFFTQILFFRRRENEFYILQALSAPLRTIRSVFLSSSLLMLPIGMLSLLFSVGCVGLCHLAVRYVLPSLFAVEGTVLTTFYLPPALCIVCLLLTLLSSVLSAYLPYLSYRKGSLAEHQPESIYQE